MIRKTQKNSGYLMVMMLVFSGIFMMILTSFVVFIVTQSRLIEQKVQFEQSGHIAEAGLNYFKWYLAHYPGTATTSVTGIYKDPEAGPIGEFKISVASTTYCGQTTALQVTATGNTYKSPNVKRSLSVRYARPTVAEYSAILNSNVWVGPDSQIVGAYHSNGGIRMDGSNNSLVSSGQSSWYCDNGYGCYPVGNRNGVFTTTSNANTSLFRYPAPGIDFSGITVDLADIKNRSKNGGLYFPKTNQEGYHVIMKNNGQVEVRRVKGKENEPNGNAWGWRMHILKNTDFLGTYTIPVTCPIMFFEDQIWLEGEVRGKVTVAAADLMTGGVDRSIILNNNITYATATSGLLTIAEYDTLIPLVVPDDMTINGIFISQLGHFGRNLYEEGNMPSKWDTYVKRNSLTINGTIVSNGRVGTKWVNSYYGYFISGFNNRFSSYDRSLMTSPPPFTPTTSDVYEFSDWQDVN